MRRRTAGWAAMGAVVLPFLMSLGCGNGGGDVPAPDAQAPPTVKTKSGVEMVVIPAGSFDMGNAHGRDDEKPVHKVWIDSFLMDKYEVTQAEFTKLGELGLVVVFANPSHFQGKDLPVEQVKWQAAALFCNTRSLLEGLKPCYDDDLKCHFEADGYRLPTEAEWEYACRAGTTTDYSFGNEARHLGDFGWFADNAGKRTHPVGQKKPNPWGLYDMHGNVAEWCHDVYHKNYYATNPPDKNPRGPDVPDAKEFVLRGGSWQSKSEALRSSYRLGENPGFVDACLAIDTIGFRCVRRPLPGESPNK
jgi:formylglycine-generating enzyme required for sulfatase activity